MKIIIDEERCTLCGSCIDLCPAEEPVFELGEKAVEVIDLDNCIECMACEVNCEYDALQYLDE
jgi:NAD-dependent dihydropyrimidine dehydrogenase PreA subunit